MSLKSDTPAPPDPAKTAAAQGAANVETAQEQAKLNNVSQYTPYGNAVYTKQPDGSYKLNVSLSPNQQALLSKGEQLGIGARDLATNQIGRIADAVSQPFSYDGIPEAGTIDQEAWNRATGDILARMEPQFQRDQDRLESRLAAQGINLGSEAYGQGMDQLSRARNDARIQADLSGLTAAGQLFSLRNTARDRAIQERAYSRAQPINEAAALMGTGQGVQMPSFTNTPQTGVAPTNVADIINQGYQNQLAYTQAQNAPINAAMGGLFGLGGSALGGWAYNGFK